MREGNNIILIIIITITIIATTKFTLHSQFLLPSFNCFLIVDFIQDPFIILDYL